MNTTRKMKLSFLAIVALVLMVSFTFNCGGSRSKAGAMFERKHWGTAGLIETDNAGNAGSPQVAFDLDGNALAVWSQYNGIWANRYVVGTGWGTPVLIKAGDWATAPQIAFDQNGNALAVWMQHDGTRFNIWANRYDAGTGWGTGWGTPELIETDDTGSASSPQIAFDQNGNALAVWGQFDGTRLSIWANRYVVGAGWGTAELIETDSVGDAYNPKIAVDPNGNAIALWCVLNTLWVNRYVAGVGWGTAGLLETDIGNASWPSIAVDPHGNAIALWSQYDGTRTNISAKRYVAGTGWGTAELIETNNAGSGYYPQIAFDANGNAVGLWSQYDGTRTNIWANRYVIGTGWGRAELIETENGAGAESPQIAVDKNGNAIAVWVEYQPDGLRLPFSVPLYNHIWANRLQ